MESRRRWQLISGMISILIGLSFLLYPQIDKTYLNSKQERAIKAFENVAKINANSQTEVFESSYMKDMNTTITEGMRGVIHIPKIGTSIPVYEGATEKSLNLGVGIIEPEKEFGVNNVGIAGHRSTTYGKQFNRLGELGIHDEIQIQTETTIYRFVVDQIQVVDRSEISVLNEKNASYITLVTCTPIGIENPQNRLIVHARLIGN